MPLTFAQAQVIVATSAGVAVEKLGRLTSRMKQWQKMGFPVGTRGVGKGAKAEYGATQIFQLLLMMKFLKLGVTPDRAAEIVVVGWDQFRHGLFRTLLSHGDRDGHRHFFFVQIDALTELTTVGAERMAVIVNCVESEIAAWYQAFVVQNRMGGSFVIEVDSLIYWVWFCLQKMGISPSIFADEFESWFDEVWRGYDGGQRDDEQFLEYRNRSPMEHDIGKLDLAHCAHEAMSLVLEKHGHG